MSIVQELQELCLDKKVSVTDLLKRCLVISSKLDLEDFKNWANQELDGYKGEVPDYRIVGGFPQVFNPYRGFQPLHCDNPKILEKISHMNYNQPISEIEAELEQLEKANEASFQISYAPDFEKLIMKGIQYNLQPFLQISTSQLSKILEGVRKVVLEWALKLESDGIIGEGLSFSKKEKEIASKTTYNVKNYIHGNFDKSQIQIETQNSTQLFSEKNFDIKKLNEFIVNLNKSVDDLKLKDDNKNELLAEIETLKSQAKSPKPKKGIIRETLLSIKTILEAASGNIIASSLLQQIGSLFG